MASSPSRFIYLTNPAHTHSCLSSNGGEEEEEELRGLLTGRRLSCRQKLASVRGLLQYMIPLGLVYFFEYLINQVSWQHHNPVKGTVSEDVG
jgi:battenin